MAITGSKFTGADFAVSLGGTVVEQTLLRDATLNQSKDVHDSTGGGGGAKEFIGGETSGSFSLTLWNSTKAADLLTLVDVTDDDGIAIIYYPKGNSASQISESFTGIFTSMDRGTEKNSVAPVTLNFQISGAITRGTV